MSDEAGGKPARTIEDFVEGRTHAPEDWRWLWEGDRRFPIRSHRGLMGRWIVRVKRWLRPLVQAPQADLWERQRRFNLTLVHVMERLEGLAARTDDIHRDLTQVRDDLKRDVKQHARRLAHLEEFKRQGLDDVTRHSDALFARVDQKFDQYRRESRDLWERLGALLAVAGDQTPSPGLRRAHEELQYIDLESRFRGLESDIAERLSIYRPYLSRAGGRDGAAARRPVLDLGCGRGEALAVLAGFGLEARGVDSSEEMVRACTEKGLAAESGDLFEALASVAEASLAGVVSFHVIEHLPSEVLERLVRLAWRALAPGGVLILETPSPLSVVVAARNFWLDPTHRRPVHPETLQLFYEQAGFESVERLDLRPFAADQRLPEVDVAALAPELQELAHGVNRLRDQLDTLLYGCQDFAMVGFKPDRDAGG